MTEKRTIWQLIQETLTFSFLFAPFTGYFLFLLAERISIIPAYFIIFAISTMVIFVISDQGDELAKKVHTIGILNERCANYEVEIYKLKTEKES